MMRLIQFLIAWLLTAQTINHLFALLCLAAVFGASHRAVMLLSAVLYLLMGLV